LFVYHLQFNLHKDLTTISIELDFMLVANVLFIQSSFHCSAAWLTFTYELIQDMYIRNWTRTLLSFFKRSTSVFIRLRCRCGATSGRQRRDGKFVYFSRCNPWSSNHVFTESNWAKLNIVAPGPNTQCCEMVMKKSYWSKTNGLNIYIYTIQDYGAWAAAGELLRAGTRRYGYDRPKEDPTWIHIHV
jgi:hypothetical protein